MGSIYKLVAERRDRNQSIKRKRNNRNINLFKESLEEVEFRRPTLYRHATLRNRTVSDQPHANDLQLPFPARRGTNELIVGSFKSPISKIDTKIDTLVKKIEEMSKSIAELKAELNKK
jgi:hypothetical protein